MAGSRRRPGGGAAGRAAVTVGPRPRPEVACQCTNRGPVQRDLTASDHCTGGQDVHLDTEELAQEQDN